jgi:hypothetical protein
MSCPNGLPPSLSGLEALNTLDLAFNNLNSTMDQVAQVSGAHFCMCMACDRSTQFPA